MRLKIVNVLFAFGLLFDGSVNAADSVPLAQGAPEEIQTVSVSSTRNPEWRSYQSLLKGQKVFEEKRHFAPNSQLRFFLRPKAAGVSLDGIQLNLVSSGQTISIPLEKDFSFSLPQVLPTTSDEFELVVNRRKGTVGWEPIVRSASVEVGKLRLGDLRLECEVSWAIEYDEIPFLLRNGLRLLGGPCSSSRGGVVYFHDRDLDSAMVVDGLRRSTILIKGTRNKFSPPMADMTWGNDSLIEFVPTNSLDQP